MTETQQLQTITITPFEASKEQLIELCKIYDNLVVNDETFEESKKARVALRDKRFEIQRIAKLNTSALNDLKNQNWENEKAMIDIIEPTETRLDNGIKEIENRKAAIKAEKERVEREKIEAEIKAENDRLAKIEADRIAAIEEANRIESERLKALQAEIDAKNKAEEERLNKIKAEQEAKEKAMEAERLKVQKEQELREAKIKAEQDKIEAEKKAIIEAKAKEEADKVRALELERAKKEAAERAILEAEAKAKLQAEQKEAAEIKAREEARIKALNAPDKEKLLTFAAFVNGIEYPTLKTDATKEILQEGIKLLRKATEHIINESSKL